MRLMCACDCWFIKNINLDKWLHGAQNMAARLLLCIEPVSLPRLACFRLRRNMFSNVGNIFSVLQCLTKEFHKHRKTRWNVRKLWEQACTHTHNLPEYVLFHAFVLGYTLAMLFCTTDNVFVCVDSRPCYCQTQPQQCFDICITSGL